jgi:hemolysin activation/secretion protein
LSSYMNKIITVFAIGVFLLLASSIYAQVIPPAGQSGTQPKTFDQSRPRFQPPEEVIPDITIEEKPTSKTPAGGPTVKVRRIKVEGNTLIKTEELEALINTPMVRELTLSGLNQLASLIAAHYADAGYMLIQSFVPRQEVQDGTVVIRVVEGRVSDSKVVGNNRYDAEEILWTFQDFQKADHLKTRDLERALLGLNDALGFDSKAFLAPGNKPGTADLLVKVKESLPFRFSFDGDNFGSRFTGRDRYGINASGGNLLRFGDELSVRAMRSNLGQNYINPSYSIPLTPFGTALRLSYIYSDHHLGSTLNLLDGEGNLHIFSASLSNKLLRTRRYEMIVSGGLNYRMFKNSLLDIVTSSEKIANPFLSVGGFVTDRYAGRTFYNTRLQLGIPNNSIVNPLSSRFDGNGGAAVFSGSLTRYQSIPFLDSYFVMKLVGQAASDRVLSPDLFIAGGMGTVRGYPLGEISGDNGYLASLEYVLPFPFKVAVPRTGLFLNQLISFFGFLDNSHVYVKDPQPGERGMEITGVGGGVRLNIPKGRWTPAVSFAATYGTPAPFSKPIPSDGSDGYWYLGGRFEY